MLLEINNLSFSYRKDSENIIEDFDMAVGEHELITIVGDSGCGKSTLLRLISGLEIPNSGIIKIDGEIVNSDTIFIEPEKRNVGMVFQDYALFPHMSVLKNVEYGLKNMSKRDKHDKAIQIIEMVGLKDHINKYPYELSGGQQQRVALARSLCPEPKLLLMDEPFSNLDANLKNRIRQEVKDILLKAKITSILVTHDMDDAKFLGSKIISMTK